MNRSELINALREETTLSRKDAEQVVDSFFGAIMETLSTGQRVEIRGFGSFTVKNYQPYMGRNPKTGIPIEVTSKRLPFFKVGKELKEMVNNNNTKN
jgi:integration host factor subunit beta